VVFSNFPPLKNSFQFLIAHIPLISTGESYVDLCIKFECRKISVSAALKSEGYWIPSSFDSYNLWSIRWCICLKNSFFLLFLLSGFPRSSFCTGDFGHRLVFKREMLWWGNRDDLELPTLAYSGPIAQGGQGPPLMLAEWFQSVITQLFQQVEFVLPSFRKRKWSCISLSFLFCSTAGSFFFSPH
jgi:hypothetical protein